MGHVERAGAFCGALVATAAMLAGCGGLSIVERNSLGAVAGTVALGHLPTSNIQQIYYLGIFDPRDQLPPMFYRVRVQGQSSAISRIGFASGWVRAELVDSLAGRVATPFEKGGAGSSGVINSTPTGPANGSRSADQEVQAGALTGRRLVLFGPEGFREAPANHRLVIVMGADPSAFFAGVDQALGIVAQATQTASAGPEIEKLLWDDLARAQLQRQRIELLLEAAQ